MLNDRRDDSDKKRPSLARSTRARRKAFSFARNVYAMNRCLSIGESLSQILSPIIRHLLMCASVKAAQGGPRGPPLRPGLRSPWRARGTGGELWGLFFGCCLYVKNRERSRYIRTLVVFLLTVGQFFVQKHDSVRT